METQEVSEVWATRRLFLWWWKWKEFSSHRSAWGQTTLLSAVAQDAETEVLFMAAGSQGWQFAEFIWRKQPLTNGIDGKFELKVSFEQLQMDGIN